jgi:hypothetical protein
MISDNSFAWAPAIQDPDPLLMKLGVQDPDVHCSKQVMKGSLLVKFAGRE